MPFDENLADRIRVCLAENDAYAEEKRMFGGIAFMVNEKMAIGVTNKGDLMVRCLAEKMESALELNGCRQMDFTGRPMKGFLFVDETGFDQNLGFWVKMCLEFAFSAEGSTKKRKKVD